MPLLMTKSVFAWLWAVSVMPVPGVLILLRWRSLSHRGDFTPSGVRNSRGQMEYNEIIF
jgi:hypothetical protein